jgi:glycosyltransferase involved in cell wall biosynthesis
MTAQAEGGPAPGRPLPEGLRLLEICRVLWNGGVQRAAIAQTQGLRARGRSCDLLFLRGVPDAAYALPEGAEIAERGTGSRRSTGADLSRAITARFAGHRGREASVDLDLLWGARERVAAHDLTIYNDQYAALLGIWMRLRHGRPYVTMFHEFYPRVAGGTSAFATRALADLLDLVSILLAPAIVTTSSKVFRRIESIAPGRTVLARLGAPTPGPATPVERRDRHSVFSITVWDRGRHPELFLEVAAALPAVRFVVAGIWTDPAHLATFRERAQHLTNLSVVGPVSESDRDRLQRESLLYLRLGYDESGPGMGGLEALEAGSIVLTNQGLGLAEIIDPGRNGFVLERPDAREVVELLRQIEGLDPGTLEQISAGAVRLAVENSWGSHVQRLEQAIGIALGPRSGRDSARPIPSPTPEPSRRAEEPFP